MKILITGSNGLIGKQTIKKLSIKNNKIFAVDNNFKKNDQNKNIKFFNIDLTEKSSLKKIKNLKIDVIIHLAAFLGVKKTEKNELKCLNENITTTKNILDFCVSKKIKRIIFASSSEVYGDGYKTSIKEDSQVMPKSVYGISKVTCESFIKAYSKKYKFNYNIIRFFNVYGPGQKKEFVIPIFLNCIKNNQNINLFGSGDQLRAFCFVDDAVEGLSKVLSKGRKNETYNIGNNLEPIKIINLAKKIKKIFNSKVKIKKISFKKSDRKQSREIFYRRPNIKKIQKECNYFPKISLDYGLKKLLND